MKKIALLFDRSYIDAHHCFRELAIHLAEMGFGVDLYSLSNSFNFKPFFENTNIQLLDFPTSKFQKLEYWYKIVSSKESKYSAIIATPIAGAELAYRTASIQKIPFYYLADELIEHLLKSSAPTERKKLDRSNYISNKKARASISLSEDRYLTQKKLNRINYPHEHFIIPNAPSGIPVRLKSNYFRDIFGIEDRKPILLFAGTLNWLLAKKIYEESKSYGERDYHIIYHARTLGLMGANNHPFIKISTMPIPAGMMNYAVSSADIGLVLYDKNSDIETMNALTGGKIGTYLKNELPLIAGSAESLKVVEEEKIGIYWDGASDFDSIAKMAIRNQAVYRSNIPAYYAKHLQYELFFEPFKQHLLKSIK
jgi:hypothetical protein